ncbi:MAG: hypothetical protein ABSC37_15640 [Xanthobacteraceae bacterium]
MERTAIPFAAFHPDGYPAMFLFRASGADEHESNLRRHSGSVPPRMAHTILNHHAVLLQMGQLSIVEFEPDRALSPADYKGV